MLGAALIAIAMCAALLASAASLRANDDFDQSPSASQTDSATTGSPHTTKLKWGPSRHSFASVSTDTASSSDESPVFSDATPLPPKQSSSRTVYDPAIVQAQALKSADPQTNPFNDDQPTPGAKPLPAPPATIPDATGPAEAPIQPAPGAVRPRVPARLNPLDPGSAAPVTPTRKSPAITPFINPSPSDVEDLSCTAHQHHCDEDEKALIQNTIGKIGLNINIDGKQGDNLPCDCSIGDGVVFAARQWPLITYTWKASALCHKPLYFEEVQLERYGHSAGPFIEPLLSAAHFFITVPLLPYYMGVDPPMECQYSLGYYRPGDCAPYMIDPIPLSVRGAILEAGAVGGVATVLP
jgi:hypothetical protein